jgi:uncharacterized membrane protein YfcA
MPLDSALQWTALLVSGLLIGLHKTGLNGAAMAIVPLMAAAFGGKVSTGVVLPMLIVGDLVAIIYYRRHADFRLVFQLLPWALVGIAAGTFVGDSVSDVTFKRIIAVAVLVSLALIVFRELRGREWRIPRKWWIAALLGTAAGFASMMGNAAGSLMALYLLAMGLPKNEFIGTGAWFFFLMNVIKVFFHVLVWNTITIESLSISAVAIPTIAVGAVVGLLVVKRIPERPYRIFIIVTTAAITIPLFM